MARCYLARSAGHRNLPVRVRPVHGRLHAEEDGDALAVSQDTVKAQADSSKKDALNFQVAPHFAIETAPKSVLSEPSKVCRSRNS